VPLGRALLAAVCAAACGGFISPLKNRLAVGEESYLVFVGDGEGGRGDLYAASTGGGAVYQVTYSRVDEGQPALSPDGRRLAFTRARRATDTTDRAVWVMNLEDGAEREVPALPGGVQSVRLAWNVDGGRLFIGGESGAFAYEVSDGEVVPAGAEAREALETRAGRLPGRPVSSCGDRGLCLPGDTGVVMLASPARDPLRWSADSLAYFVGDDLQVRPLAGGRVRVIPWRGAPPHPRQPTVFLFSP
jgi:hypothetical protein